MEPRVILRLTDKNGRRYLMLGGALKIKKRANSELIRKARLGDFKRLYIHVNYGRDRQGEIINSMYPKTPSDFNWALDAFLDPKLWVEKG